MSLKDISLNVNYVIILNTNAGLWGYNIGDTVKFVSKNPYRIIVSGRLKHFTSAFGEHVIAEEIEKSLEKALKIEYAEVNELHIAPEVNPNNGLPFHCLFIEFRKEPENLEKFATILDLELQKLNSYYKDLISGGVLKKLEIFLVKKNGFRDYMDSVGKLGGQNKVPRLANDKTLADKLIKYV